MLAAIMPVYAADQIIYTPDLNAKFTVDKDSNVKVFSQNHNAYKTGGNNGCDISIDTSVSSDSDGKSLKLTTPTWKTNQFDEGRTKLYNAFGNDALTDADKGTYTIYGKALLGKSLTGKSEEKFGVGILMPNADRYVASRGEISTNYFTEKENTRYYKEFFSFDESKEMIPSYAAINYSYINPSILRKMVNFVPLEYKYALFVGTTEEMSATFDGLKKDGVVTNDNLLDKENGWPVA
jgi:hypothetical protein